jgi:indole-3-glycerol phosphate synthase
MILDQILAIKRREWSAVSASLDPRALTEARPPLDFEARLRTPGLSVIAEIKPKSPSRGEFAPARDSVSLARCYEAAGAGAISVLADSTFFGGSPELVAQVANQADVTLPVMYKDFIVDVRQVHLARACGADAVLLIARAVDAGMLSSLVTETHALAMTAVVETFEEREIEAAVDAGARVIGINNRDLQSFRVDLRRSERLVKVVPSGVLKVSESGITNRTEILTISGWGFDGALIGEALLTSGDPAETLRSLLGSPSQNTLDKLRFI